MIPQNELQFKLLLQSIKNNNKTIFTRNKTVKYTSPFMFQVDLLHPYLFSPFRPLPYKFIIAEFLTFLCDRFAVDRIAFLKQFCKNIDEFSENDANYGYRWRILYNVDQIKQTIDLLKQDLHSRRAVMTTYSPIMDSSVKKKDVPCNVFQQFFIDADMRLNLYNIVRSQDIILGLPIDICHFTLLYNVILNTLKAEIDSKISLGAYYHIILNPHYYLEDEHVVNTLLRHDFAFIEIYHPVMKLTLSEATKYANNVIEGVITDKYLSTPYADWNKFSEEYFRKVYKIFYENSDWRNKK
jgi:thymidylate synthase